MFFCTYYFIFLKDGGVPPNHSFFPYLNTWESVKYLHFIYRFSLSQRETHLFSLSIYQPTYLSTYQSTYLSTSSHISIPFTSMYLYIIYLPIYQSTYPSISCIPVFHLSPLSIFITRLNSLPRNLNQEPLTTTWSKLYIHLFLTPLPFLPNLLLLTWSE